MARKLQKLINYHTSSNTSMPAAGEVALGEIVVRHHDEKPELLIKKNDESFATFIDSVAVENAISVAETRVEGQVTALSNSVTAFSATVVNDYATKADVATDIATAKSEAIAAASAYTDGEISELNEKLSKDIETVDAHVTTVSASVKTFSATVISDYATKTGVTADIATAKSEAIAAASAYTDSKVDGINSGLTADIAGVEKKVDTLIGSDSGKSARSIAIEEVVKVVSGAPESFDTLKEIADWIGTASGAGAATLVADIEALKKADGDLSKSIEDVDGRVTTLNNSFTAFQGTVESTYATKTGVTADIATAKSEAIAAASAYTDGEISELDEKLSEEIETVDAHVDTVSASVKTFSATVISDYATKVVASGYADTAKTEAVSSAKGYTDGEITKLNSGLTADINALDGRIDKLEELTGTTNSAIQKIEVSGITGVNVVENGTTRTLDFTEMVIDCGDF